MSTFNDHWQGVRSRHQTIIEMRLCHISSLPNRYGRLLVVVCPQDQTFTRGANELGGKYLKRTYCWHFPYDSLDQVYCLCRDVYGQAAIRADRGL